MNYHFNGRNYNRKIMNTFNEHTIEQKVDSQLRYSTANYSVSRLEFLKKLTLLTGAIITGCTPVRVLLKSYPDKYDYNKKMCKQILDSFVLTVIPGANLKNKNLCRIFHDDYYNFSSYRGFFISDLCSKSKKIFQNENFSQLSLKQRTKVIQYGLEDDSTTAKLYTGAIFMAQVSYYCCIYDDEKGCELIDFQGNYGFMNTDMYYKDCAELLADEITLSGNYS